MMLNKEEKDFLLKLARISIEYFLSNKTILKFKKQELPSEKLNEKKGCFVTLTINSALRGCIGHLLPVKELYKDVIENAINAAFYDPRFAKLTKKEFKTIKIEISVLGIPTKLNYSSEKELLDKLNKNKPGIIIKKGYHQATFLPQVWEELATAELFLSELCLKAGLNSKEWKDNIDIEIYDVEKFKEE